MKPILFDVIELLQLVRMNPNQTRLWKMAWTDKEGQKHWIKHAGCDKTKEILAEPYQRDNIRTDPHRNPFSVFLPPPLSLSLSSQDSFDGCESSANISIAVHTRFNHSSRSFNNHFRRQFRWQVMSCLPNRNTYQSVKLWFKFLFGSLPVGNPTIDNELHTVSRTFSVVSYFQLTSWYSSYLIDGNRVLNQAVYAWC